MSIHDNRDPAVRAGIGPLAQYEPALRAQLLSVGYVDGSIRRTVRRLRHMSCWMADRHIGTEDLSGKVIAEYVEDRQRQCGNHVEGANGVRPLLRFLRTQGVEWEPDQPTAVGELLNAYRAWLITERGLASSTVRVYTGRATVFLAQLSEPLETSLARMDAPTVIAFLLGQTTTSGALAAREYVPVLRSLMLFLHVSGLISTSLATVVPRVAGWRLSTLPRALPLSQVQALLHAHDLTSRAGLRDHAVLVILARLGLRSAEVAALRLADIDWRAGEIMVRGKGSCFERLPLPEEVGVALVNYLTDGRPRCSCPTLFVTVRAPYQPMTSYVVHALMARSCRLAGLPRLGSHRLRHTLATDLLRSGASLSEVGQVLRHRDERSTALYAKVDQASLRMLAMPWPGDSR